MTPLSQKNIHLYDSFKNKVMSHYKKGGKVIPLEKHKLPNDMYDTEIIKEYNTKPVSLNDFVVTLNSLIKNKKLDDYNIFHVNTPNGVVAVGVFRDGVEWFVSARELDYDYRWSEGYSFFSPATVDSLNLETRIKNLEQEIMKIKKVVVY